MKIKKTSRREAMQQMGLLAAALCSLPLASCGTPGKESAVDAATTIAPIPFLIPPNASLEVGPLGSNMRTLIRSAQTNTQFSCVEAILAPKKIAGSPHKHDRLDELMYVLEGTASVLMDDKVVTVPVGSWHLRPRGIVHVVWNSGNENLRLIDMYFNQNFEDYLEELYHKIIPEVIERKISFEDPGIAKRVAELDKKFGLTYYPEQSQAIVEKYGLS
ncbi:mannose-6-phosphate isomerase-like protein (cupin superfamily) [Pedobacter africanus]|uniref:Mannose-6-phosphate isomerase-like protein (Cupin superfamily) n=1 Tax=Pedobacter africanus TaxID=151894 RepID=A0ACC6KXY4_9SPHI|nr:cupin domain-containing protein [Pedobacter africanus]MDR6783916.1 mannose-6-phosphate isomerase-like protein (cupin superfamily) [Pedobacter africanus]